MTNKIITLTTDFETRDGYVGAMKGRILSICPKAQIHDLTHDIPPQDLLAANLLKNTIQVPMYLDLHCVYVVIGIHLSCNS